MGRGPWGGAWGRGTGAGHRGRGGARRAESCAKDGTPRGGRARLFPGRGCGAALHRLGWPQSPVPRPEGVAVRGEGCGRAREGRWDRAQSRPDGGRAGGAGPRDDSQGPRRGRLRRGPGSGVFTVSCEAGPFPAHFK